MSIFGDTLLAGSAAVIPVLNAAGPDAPFFAPASGGGGGGGSSSFSTLSVSSLTVSSINGAAPGSSGFTSSFNAPVVNGTSTLLMSLPPGTWAYNGQMLYTGSQTYTAGFMTSLQNLSSSVYYASIMPFLAANNVPLDTNPNGLISITNGGNPLSTVNVYAVNPSTLSGNANWIGAISKL